MEKNLKNDVRHFSKKYKRKKYIQYPNMFLSVIFERNIFF